MCVYLVPKLLKLTILFYHYTHMDVYIMLLLYFCSEGIVEVYTDEWTAVCGNSFTNIEAAITCRQLGYATGKGDVMIKIINPLIYLTNYFVLTLPLAMLLPNPYMNVLLFALDITNAA